MRELEVFIFFIKSIRKTALVGQLFLVSAHLQGKYLLFIDHQLKYLVPQIPSYVKDTNDFLAKLKDMERFPDGAILVNIDVVGLYPNIPHDEGLEALQRTLNKRSNPVIPTDHIVNLAELVLKNNNFEFDGIYKSVVQPLVQGWHLHMLIYLCTTVTEFSSSQTLSLA